MRFVILTAFLCFSLLSPAQDVSWNVQLIGNWYDSNIPFTGKGSTYNEVWGFVWKDREYGVIGSRKGTYIIDVTDHEYPVLVKFIAGNYQNAINRDFHDYRGYLYMVADQDTSTFQIVDLHYLPDSVVLIYDSDELFQRCHNIFIDSAAARLYACSVKKGNNKDDLHIYSLAQPDQPELLLVYNDAPSAFHDIYVKNDTAFGNNEREGLFIYDFTDLDSPKIIGSLVDYPGKGYNHSGWVSDDESHYFFADETNGSDIKVCDITSIADVEVVSTFNSGVATDAIAHNLIVKDSLLYISYYHDGLQIFNISDPTRPEKAGFYDTYLRPDHEGGKGAWGVYPFLPSGVVLVSDREKGLFIFDVHDALLYVKPNPVTTLVDIFPNPFSSFVTISILQGQTISSIEVFDIRGTKIMESHPEQTNTLYRMTAVEPLPAGIYFIRLEGDNLSVNKKLVKSF